MNNIPILFTLSGYETALIQPENTSELQTLMEKCADYSLMVDGHPPDPSEAARLLVDCPPGKTVADKLVIGFSNQNKGLIGVLDTVRDYPTERDWWLGLLVLDPAYRNHGLGRQIVQAFESWVGQQGARRIFLGVVAENAKAYQFWLKLGFDVIERHQGRQFGDLTHEVVIMVRNISEA